MASSSIAARSSKYTYRSSGGTSADVNIEYSADLSALSRLEVKFMAQFLQHFFGTNCEFFFVELCSEPSANFSMET